MSMTEPTPAPAPARKHKRPNKRKAAAARQPASELAGITVKNCPAACNAERCVISGRGICSHPHKGGLQGRDMGDPAALGRFSAAKKLLGKRLVDLNNA